MNSPKEPFLPPEPDPAIQRLPKCNLHTHLEGSVRPATLLELASEQGVALELPAGGLRSALQVDGRESSLLDYLSKISFSYPVLKNAAALRRTAFEAAEDAAMDGVAYFELRAGPVTHMRAGLPIELVIESLLAGLTRAEAGLGITCRLIVSALRNHDPQVNLRLAYAALDFKDQGVVGFDLAGDEAGCPAQAHAEAFRVARAGGLGITVHAGEAAGAENVRYAVIELEAARIGHGVRSVESRKVLNLLADRRVVLELCPTSNVHTRAVDGIASHPVRGLFDRGIPLSIGDDDPVTSRTRVSNELTLLRDRFGFDLNELREIQGMGIAAAFLEDSGERQRLAKAIDGQWSELDSERMAGDLPPHSVTVSSGDR